MIPFAATTFVAAFLLFQVQPLIAKYILPWFGGGPGVWTACMLFFQVALLAGYAYAHLLTRLTRPALQAVVHVGLVALALFTLPITPGAEWRPDTPESPVQRILGLLVASVGLPYFVLSTTGPLMQSWFSRTHPGRSPYRLYALSNVGSLLALLSYPVLFEPWLSRFTQASTWGWGFAAFALCLAACALQLFGVAPERAGGTTGAATADEAPTPTTVLLWFALPACASVLLLAVTNTICLDVAVVPFLWVLPLSLYLVSFILCFDSPRWYNRRAYGYALVVCAALACVALAVGHRFPLVVQIAVFSATLFTCCMICHGELYRLKPPARGLTLFYLMLAAGGATGGVLVAIVAPRIFSSYAELPWGLWLMSVLLVLVHKRAGTTIGKGARRLPAWAAASVGTIVLGAALVAGAGSGRSELLHATRNFYGVLEVREWTAPGSGVRLRGLYHGTTMHGVQLQPPDNPLQPVGYYEKGSGVELAFSRFPRQNERRIGVVGLGLGTLAIHAHETDIVRFYEINPEVERLARSMFTFLDRARASVEIVLGDARISLENEPPQRFDLLVLDAFTSDAIPVHLLTREALAVYVRHLQPDGALLFNITNRHLDVESVVRTAAAELGFRTVTIRGSGGVRGSAELDWMIVSHNPVLLDDPAIAGRASRPRARSVVLWTDDHSSLLQVLRPLTRR